MTLSSRQIASWPIGNTLITFAHKSKAHSREQVRRFGNAKRIPNALVERFVERLVPIRMMPDRILELGCAAGDLRAALRERYRSAQVVSMERHAQFCTQSRATAWRRVFRDDLVLCALPDAVPLPSASVDMVCANLSWAKAEELATILHECARVLRAPGLLVLASYGPQTLIELREVWSTLDDCEHTHRFADMHDIGDAMVAAALSDVVVDSERLTVEFDDLPSLLREVRDIGGGNRSTQRRRALTTANRMRSLAAAYADAGGYVTASVELVFAHAWLVQRPGIPVAGPIGSPLNPS